MANYDEARAIASQAETARSQKDFALAVKLLSEAIKLWPDNHSYYEQRAYCFIENQEFEKAIADYSTVIEMYPDSASFYSARIEAYMLAGNHEKAFEDAEKIIELSPR